MKSKIIKLTLIFILLYILIPLASQASEVTNNPNTNYIEQTPKEKLYSELSSQSCILIECSTGKTAFEKNSNLKMYPASTTKLLTAIITLEKCKLTDTVTITNDMINKVPSGYTTAYLQPGETLTIEQLLNILLIPSANDAGFCLAIHISGSIENFSELMNKRAKELGCTNSNFINPNGIHHENHYSTAKDMSIIGMYALKNPIISEICSKTSYTLKTQTGNVRTFETTNTLLKQSEKSYYEYATGLKTGFTIPAGSCIVATAKKENMNFLAVVLNAPPPTTDSNYRDNDCKLLFEYGFLIYNDLTKFDTTFFNFFKNLINSDNSLITIINSFLFITIFYTFIIILLKFKNKKNDPR